MYTIIENGELIIGNKGETTIEDAILTHANSLKLIPEHSPEFDYNKDDDIWLLMDYIEREGYAEQLQTAFLGKSHENGIDDKIIEKVLFDNDFAYVY